jgi:hypothetical protein
VPSHRPSSENAIAIIIELKPGQAFLCYATAILLKLTTSALKGTDAFGPGSNRIEQLDCRLDRGNRKPRQLREFLNSNAYWLGLPILVDAAVVAADPLQLLFDCPLDCVAFKFRIGWGLLDWCRKRCDFVIG